MYNGDIRLGDTIDVKFTTRQFSSGAPFTLAGSPAVAAYVGNGTTEITGGITLTVDFDSRTGLNNVRVVASGGNGFATATNVALVITAGTVDGVSVVGETIGSFSIENRSALMATTPGRTLAVDPAGLADANAVKLGPSGSGTAQTARDIGASVLLSSGTGTGQLNFSSGVVQADAAKVNGVATTGVTSVNANLGTTQPVNFTGTAGSALVKTDVQDFGGSAGTFSSGKPAVTVASTDITGNISADLQTIKTQTVTAAAGVTFPTSIASPTNITAGTMTTVTNLTNAPTSGDFTATMKTSLNAATPSLSTAGNNAVADAYLDRADAIEVGLTPRQAERLNVAASAGKLSGAATTTVVIRNAVADSKDRITATVDASGNRSAVTTVVT